MQDKVLQEVLVGIEKELLDVATSEPVRPAECTTTLDAALELLTAAQKAIYRAAWGFDSDSLHYKRLVILETCVLCAMDGIQEEQDLEQMTAA